MILSHMNSVLQVIKDNYINIISVIILSIFLNWALNIPLDVKTPDKRKEYLKVVLISFITAVTGMYFAHCAIESDGILTGNAPF